MSFPKYQVCLLIIKVFNNVHTWKLASISLLIQFNHKGSWQYKFVTNWAIQEDILMNAMKHRDRLCKWDWKIHLLLSGSDNHHVARPQDKAAFWAGAHLETALHCYFACGESLQMAGVAGSEAAGVMECNPILRQVSLLDTLIDLIC